MEEIHILCQFGKGFSHTEAYEMPIRYRQYYLKKTLEYLEKQNNINNSDVVSSPAPDKVELPDFITKVKASKK